MSEFVDKHFKGEDNVLENVQEYLLPEADIEGTGYKRGLLDRRIEKYLDSHFEEYIEEFGLVRELDLEVYEDKYNFVVDNVKEIKEFQKDAEAEISSLNKRLDRIEKKM